MWVVRQRMASIMINGAQVVHLCTMINSTFMRMAISQLYMVVQLLPCRDVNCYSVLEMGACI